MKILRLNTQQVYNLENVGSPTTVSVCVCVLVVQSCLTLWDPMDCGPPDSSVHGMFLARILEWVAIPSPVALPDRGIEPRSPALQADALTSEPPGEPYSHIHIVN